MLPGTYVDNKGNWIQIEGVGRNQRKQLIAVYYDYGKVDRTGKLIHRACPVSELKKKRGLRPIEDKDYGPGGPAEYYREHMGS